MSLDRLDQQPASGPIPPSLSILPIAKAVTPMKTESVAIPAAVLSSVETLDELQDWLTAQNPELVTELRAARKEDLAGKFKLWKSRQLACPTAE
jgi:hypothetical protein